MVYIMKSKGIKMSYITIKEASERMGVSAQTIHNWVRWGVLRGYRLFRNPSSQRPGRILVEEEDLEDKYLGKIVHEEAEGEV